MKQNYEVYDKVWLMINNKPAQYLIYSVTESMSVMKTKTKITYSVVSSILGAGVGNNSDISVGQELLFDSKEALLRNL